MDEITIYTDGSCLDNANSGPSGWSAIVVTPDKEICLGEGFYRGTNNRMEIMGILCPMELLTTPHAIHFYADSEYAMKGAQFWAKGWQRNGWMTRDGKPVKNRDLWERMLTVVEFHKLRFTKVKGHSNDHYNEIADKVAKDHARNPKLHDSVFEATLTN